MEASHWQGGQCLGTLTNLQKSKHSVIHVNRTDIKRSDVTVRKEFLKNLTFASAVTFPVDPSTLLRHWIDYDGSNFALILANFSAITLLDQRKILPSSGEKSRFYFKTTVYTKTV